MCVIFQIKCLLIPYLYKHIFLAFLLAACLSALHPQQTYSPILKCLGAEQQMPSRPIWKSHSIATYVFTARQLAVFPPDYTGLVLPWCQW